MRHLMHRAVQVAALLLVVGVLAACGGGGGGSPAVAPSSAVTVATVATETWTGTTDSGSTSATLTKRADGSVAGSGTWYFLYNGYHVTCPFTAGAVAISGSSVSFTGTGVATTPDAPAGYQTSPFILTVKGDDLNGQGSGTFTIQFSTFGWPSSISGNWVATRSSGGGITAQTFVSAALAPPSWIQGTWTGGSPTSLRLTFTANNVLNSSNAEEFAGFVETEKTDTVYHLVKSSTGEESIFTRGSGSDMSWFTKNNSISNSVTMTRN